MKNYKMLDRLILYDFFDNLDLNFLSLISNFSLSTYGLVFLRNELLLNNRENVIEFGSGLSTLFMAHIVKKHQLKTKICTIESGEKWINIIQQKAEEQGLSKYIKIIHAPLVVDQGNGHWYDSEILHRELQKEKFFDMVVIDGPPAFEPQIAKSRYAALPFVYEILADNCFLFLDDVNRKGEQEIVQRWRSQFEIDFTVINKRFAVYWKGIHRVSKPSVLNSLIIRDKYQTTIQY